MKGILKGIQSVLVAMAVLCMVGTGVILWFNHKGGDTDVAAQTEVETETVQAEGETQQAFPDAIPVNTVSDNSGEVTTAVPAEMAGKHDGRAKNYVASVVKNPTCSEVGVMRYQSPDGDFYTEAIPTLEHHAGEWTTVKAATTAETGLRRQTCTRCGEIVKEETIPKTTAAATNNNTKKDTTDTSTKKKKGKDEDENHVHAFEAAETTAATCIKDGVMTYTCTCDASYTAPIPATGHPSRKTMVTEATCTEPGTVITSCAICDAVISQDSTPSLGHSFGRWVMTTAPTKDAVGKYTRTCIRCDEKEEKEIPKTTDPSSTHQHEYVMETTKAPSCTEDGQYTYSCSCGEKYTEDVSAYGHSPSNWITVDLPTETQNGKRQKVCRRCGEVVAEEEIAFTPTHTHNYGSTPIASRAATCTSTGYKTYMCTICGQTYTTQQDMLPHRFRNGVCTVCGTPE